MSLGEVVESLSRAIPSSPLRTGGHGPGYHVIHAAGESHIGINTQAEQAQYWTSPVFWARFLGPLDDRLLVSHGSSIGPALALYLLIQSNHPNPATMKWENPSPREGQAILLAR
jgi:hypothetical protein